mgnify:CR=1 FL=1
MTTKTTTNAQEQHPAVRSAVPTTALDDQAGTGAIAIFYGAARYPFELARQRDLAWDMVTSIPGVSCVKPRAALYLFPRLDPTFYPVKDDQQFILQLLEHQKVLLVQGTGFNWPEHDHFRVVFLPNSDDLTEALTRVDRFLADYRAGRVKGV